MGKKHKVDKMNHEVTLELNGRTDTVVVEEVKLNQRNALLKGLDPSQCRPTFRENIRFLSKGLSAIVLYEGNGVTLESVSPTKDEPDAEKPVF